MKVRGTSEFAVRTNLNFSEVVDAVGRVLESLRSDNPHVIDATFRGETAEEVVIELVFRAVSFGEVQSVMESLPELVAEALNRSPGTAIVSGRATELVPA